MTAEHFEQVIISDTNRTPIVQVFNWLALVLSILSFLTHILIKLFISRALKVESWLVLGSLILCIGQSIAVAKQAEHGFGKPLYTLSAGDVRAALQSEYAATILFICSIGCSKLAIISFVHSLTPSTTHRAINFGIGVVSSLWLFCSAMVAAFQCRMPDPWNRVTGQCINRVTWWDAVSILNMITEVVIVALELGITSRLQIAPRRKAGVMSLFACRLMVPIVAIVQLVILHRESNDPALKNDLTLGYWRSTICNQLVQCLAILTTCLPYTKLFMEGFDSGLMRFDDLRRRGEHTVNDKSREYQLMDISRSMQANNINVSKSWNVRTDPARSPSAAEQ